MKVKGQSSISKSNFENNSTLIKSFKVSGNLINMIESKLINLITFNCF